MCHKNIYTYVYSDGRRAERVNYDLCENSHHNQPCKLTKTFQHPVEYLRPGQLSPPPFAYGQFPPTPPLSSHSASASDSEHSSKERSVYINGEKVVDPSRRPSRREKGDRTTIYIESPSSSSRGSGRRYSVSRSAPSSPRDGSLQSQTRETRRRETSDERDRPASPRHRPTIVKVVNEKRQDKHHGRGSSSGSASGGSKSSSQGEDDEERKQRRQHSHVRFEDDEKQKNIKSEIERANEAIANRPAVPTTTSSTTTTTTALLPTRYRRGSVVVDRSENTSLVAAMDQLNLEREKLEREKRRRERRAAEFRDREEEAQKQRLMERMAPKRRATVSSHGRARQKVLYDDGMYYWE
ncbi:hypothetical protein AAE478_003240 [Parahypoxylon ruwenzoriense]